MAEPVLELRGISRRFGSVVASDNVSLSLRAGEIHALIGPNGAGKSTLIGQIAGEIAPEAGQVLLDGRDITALRPDQRARAGLARTFQVSQVAPDLTVRENVALAVLGRVRGIFGMWRGAIGQAELSDPAEEALARVGLQARAGSLAAALSHGERRRLELAMALAQAPRVFLLDEPMAGLGTEGAAELTALLAELRAEAPILLVEHDMDAVFALADRVTVLVQGRVLATGTVAEVRADAQVQAAYLGEEA